MSRNIEEAGSVNSCRVRRTAEARIAKSSQMPVDFFPDHRISAKVLPKTRCRDKYIEQEDKKTF